MRGQWTLLCKGNLAREISMYNQALSSLNLTENKGERETTNQGYSEAKKIVE